MPPVTSQYVVGSEGQDDPSKTVLEDAIDGSTFYERPMCLPVDQHLLTISAPAIIEFEVEATCCSQTVPWIGGQNQAT